MRMFKTTPAYSTVLPFSLSTPTFYVEHKSHEVLSSQPRELLSWSPSSSGTCGKHVPNSVTMWQEQFVPFQSSFFSIPQSFKLPKASQPLPHFRILLQSAHHTPTSEPLHLQRVIASSAQMLPHQTGMSNYTKKGATTHAPYLALLTCP
jgi:hypothetical protein